MWGNSKISERKNSPFSVKHGKLKKKTTKQNKTDTDHIENEGSMRQFSSKAKASKAMICNCITKLVYLAKTVKLRQD